VEQVIDLQAGRFCWDVSVHHLYREKDWYIFNSVHSYHSIFSLLHLYQHFSHFAT
jgi:hypothetical protein